MFVITADQVNSRERPDAVKETITALADVLADGLTLPPDRSAGDEVQLLTDDGSTALDAILRLTRTKTWSVGLGVGAVRQPLGASIRESTGPAFIVDTIRARARPGRCRREGRRSLPRPAAAAARPSIRRGVGALRPEDGGTHPGRGGQATIDLAAGGERSRPGRRTQGRIRRDGGAR
jgi:hypothetical protein